MAREVVVWRRELILQEASKLEETMKPVPWQSRGGFQVSKVEFGFVENVYVTYHFDWDHC